MAYLFEQWLAVLHHRWVEDENVKAKAIADPDKINETLAGLNEQRKTGRRILKQLRRINVTDQTFVDKRIYSIPVLDESQTQLFNILQVPIPLKVIV